MITKKNWLLFKNAVRSDRRIDKFFSIMSSIQTVEPNSTRFKVLCGIPQDIGLDHPYYFTVDIPQLFCAKFKYSGDLLDIGDVLKTDFARFLKISKQETENSHIELIQVFDTNERD